jgi:hypothetical protein
MSPGGTAPSAGIVSHRFSPTRSHEILSQCAARFGKPDRAIDFLLHSALGFQFDARGLATGGPFHSFPLMADCCMLWQ